MLTERQNIWMRSLVSLCQKEGFGISDIKVLPGGEAPCSGPPEAFRILLNNCADIGIALLSSGVVVFRDYSRSSPVNLRKVTHEKQAGDLLKQLKTRVHSIHLN